MKLGLCLFLLSLCFPSFAQLGTRQLSTTEMESINEQMKIKHAEHLKRQRQAESIAEQEKKAQERAMRDYELAREVAIEKIRDLPPDAPGTQAQLDEFACTYPALAHTAPKPQAIDACIAQRMLKREQERQDAEAEEKRKIAEKARQQAEDEQRIRQEQLAEQAQRKKAEELAAQQAAEAAAREAERTEKLMINSAVALGLAVAIAVVYRCRKELWNKIKTTFSLGAVSEATEGKLTASEFSRNTGLAGALLLLVGVFTPIVRVPIVGSLNYFRNGQGDGVVVLLIAALSLFFVLTQRIKNLFWTAGASMAVIVFTAGHLAWKMDQAKSEMVSSLKGNPFQFLAEAAVNSTQMEWGWGVLLLGSSLMFVSAFAHKKELTRSESLGSTEQHSMVNGGNGRGRTSEPL